MLNNEQQRLLQTLLDGLTPEQKIWLAGYVQGLTGRLPDGAGAAASSNKPEVHIFYATETGNSKALSLSLMKAVKGAGFKVKSNPVNRMKFSDIPKSGFSIFLASTHGEGDPPESAVKFFESVRGAPDGALAGLQFAALGLGDKSYQIFCGAATELEKELTRLGGTAIQEIALFDVDYAAHTPKWISQTVETLNKLSGDTGASVSAVSLAEPSEVRTGKGYTRLEPVAGRIKHIVNLNDIDSKKQTYHIEIAYDDAVPYSCGDAAGIILPLDAEGKEQTPRLYSIASAPSAHEGEVHLTVALASYKKEDGSLGFGVCSKYLADMKEGDALQFYIHQNQMFRLPPDDTDIIMIGPGTGVAPFRSFVFERAERGASGRNWLFFGDQHAHCDFLYQAEWQEFLATDALHKIDLAFSRDTDHKVYVQHKMKERAKELMEWIEGGARIYVCGAKDPMSHDVEKTLIEIIAAQKSLSPEAAADYLADMGEADRYLKDVY